MSLFFTMSSRFIIIFILLTCRVFAQVGDRCVVKLTDSPGICRRATDCPVVKQQAQNGIQPTFCNLRNLNLPIVCCEENSFPQPNDDTLLNSAPNPESIIFQENDKEEEKPQVLSKSEEKCLEYSRAITSTVQVITLVTHTEPENVHIEKCEYNGIGLIVGGEPASAGEFPFMAALGYLIDGTIEWRCGGTLISEHYVVTAAHCISARDGDKLSTVRLGDINLRSEDDGTIYKDYNVRDVTVHPKYNSSLKYYDIALVRLTEKVTFTKFIRPACLYTQSRINQAQAIATGWGKTDYTAAEISDLLLKVSLKIHDNRICSSTYSTEKKLPRGITSDMLCAGDLQGGKDTCRGDSGGPLLVTQKSNQCKFYLVGVTSFGKACGVENTPAVYTRVSSYVPWIETIVW